MGSRRGVRCQHCFFISSCIILAFKYDTDVGGNSTVNVKEKFIKLESSAKLLSLQINETKCMVTTRVERRDRVITKGQYYLERVHEFKYIRATISSDNNLTKEINNRIQSRNILKKGNKPFYIWTNKR